MTDSDGQAADPAPVVAVHDASPRTIVLESRDGARAEVHLHGAHVTSWTPAGADRDALFLSRTAEFRPGTAIRGGIPVIFPQFAAEGPLPKHGFARDRAWRLMPGERPEQALFELRDTPETRAIWNHAFCAELRVTVSGAVLDVALTVQNTGDEPISFTAALHTYLHVDDVAHTVLRGLRGTRIRDKVAEAERVEEAEELRIHGEVDRVYLDAPPSLELTDGERRMRIRALGFPDTVVWNPGPEAAARLADLEPGGEQRMLCVEAAAVGTPVRLQPGERWTGAQTLTCG
ncbi:MAG TPA: D-hexose-6-phosphate mutarotase [Longimicrobium sp.]|jgi:glucose-6-phosphate 1-epimerase|uniref:D-hexose-6-phosphate mutarotase n=1 Tax=Longimicrobium sp. TaxID=2029185 RepID=UPI002EDB7869